MTAKEQPNRRIYIEALRNLGPDGRLRKALELTDYARQLFLAGLESRFPGSTEAEIARRAAELTLRRARCRSKTS